MRGCRRTGGSGRCGGGAPGETSEARPGSRDYALLGLLALAWGASFLFVDLAVETMPPVTVALGRLGIAAGALLLALKAQQHALPHDGRLWGCFLALAVFGNALPYVLIATAQQRVPSGLAGILIGTTPLVTMLLAHPFARNERLNLRRLLGIGAGSLGLVVLFGGGALKSLDGDWTGQALLLLAALSYAVNNVLAARLPARQPIAVKAFAVTFLGALLLFPMAVLVEAAPVEAPSLVSLGAVATLGLVSTAAATLLFFRLVTAAGPTFVASTNYLVPLVAVALGALLLGERPGWNALLALVLILAGIYLARRR